MLPGAEHGFALLQSPPVSPPRPGITPPSGYLTGDATPVHGSASDMAGVRAGGHALLLSLDSLDAPPPFGSGPAVHEPRGADLPLPEGCSILVACLWVPLARLALLPFLGSSSRGAAALPSFDELLLPLILGLRPSEGPAQAVHLGSSWGLPPSEARGFWSHSGPVLQQKSLSCFVQWLVGS